jgi:hypothetical protein
MDMDKSHALHNRSGYWETYAEGMGRAFKTLGVPVVSPSDPLCCAAGAEYQTPMAHTFKTVWELNDGRIANLGICYADHGPDRKWPEVDAVMAMRFHPTRHESGQMGNVLPAGFPISIGYSTGNVDTFLSTNLPALKSIKDSEVQSSRCYFNEGHFRTITCPDKNNFPNRERFLSWIRKEYGYPEKSTDSRSWHKEIASNAWALNLCGQGNSIDRKVIEMCAIGTGIISDRGLEDLELPFGYRFIHGKNIWFIDDPEEIDSVVKQVSRETWRKLVDGSRLLYEKSLSPEAIGQWFLMCADKVAR